MEGDKKIMTARTLELELRIIMFALKITNVINDSKR